MDENMSIKGGGVRRLMENSILNFHFVFWNTSLNTFVKVLDLWNYVCCYMHLSIYCISRPLLYKTKLKISNLVEASLPLNWNLLLIWTVMLNWCDSVCWNYQLCNVWFWFGLRSSVRQLKLVPKVACFPNIGEIV